MHSVGLDAMDRLRSVSAEDRKSAWKEEKERKLAKLKQLRAEREKRRKEQLGKEVLIDYALCRKYEKLSYSSSNNIM